MNQGGNVSQRPKSKDPGWKYNKWAYPGDKNSVRCNFCGFISKAGICRAKQHLIGGYRNVRNCEKVPDDVKAELIEYVERQKAKKNNDDYQDYAIDLEDGGYGDDEPDEDEAVENEAVENQNTRNKRARVEKPTSSRSNVKGPLDFFVTKEKAKGKKIQSSLNDACDKELRGRTCQKIAAFFYEAGIAFNVAKMPCFKEMLQAVGVYGPHLKPPSYYELRVPLLANAVGNVDEWVKEHRLEWEQHGCSIMSDGWTDRKQRTLINFLVNSAKGSVFMESVDASAYTKTGEKVFELLDNFVEKVGAKNVVQVITDNGSNFKKAG